MVLLDQLWDDVVAGPQPERGLKQLKSVYTRPTNTTTDGGGEGSGIKYQRSLSMPASPRSPEWGGSPSPTGGKRDNEWRSVFNPGSNLATNNIGSDYFDTLTSHRPMPLLSMTGFAVGIPGASIVELLLNYSYM